LADHVGHASVVRARTFAEAAALAAMAHGARPDLPAAR
jgi:hypothetical protein